jgi:hypothetical protein
MFLIIKRMAVGNVSKLCLAYDVQQTEEGEKRERRRRSGWKEGSGRTCVDAPRK